MRGSPGRRSIEYVRPWLYEKQRQAIWDEARYSWIEASTKAGKTVGCLIWLFEQALQAPPGGNLWWVAPIFPVSKIAFRRMLRMIPPALYTANRSDHTITLANDVTIWFKSAHDPDSLYGEDVFAAVLDEASRMKEEAFTAVRSTLTFTRGPIRIIGNVKGRKNWFYRNARLAEEGRPNHAFHKITAWDAVEAGVLERDEILDAKASLPLDVFEELYLGIPTEDGSNPFGIKFIQSCIQPVGEAKPEVWGWDLAESTDWTVGVPLNADGVVSGPGPQRFQKPWPETTREILRMTGERPAFVDQTGVGKPIVEDLQANGTRPNFEGFVFSAKSKQELIGALAVAIQNQDVGFPEGFLSIELEAFEYVHTRTGVRYEAPAGYHDDGVMALALAWKRLKEPVAVPFIS